MQKRYTVKAPDGRTVIVEGPEGASQQEVIAQAQRLLRARPQGPPAQPADPRANRATMGRGELVVAGMQDASDMLTSIPADIIGGIAGMGKAVIDRVRRIPDQPLRPKEILGTAGQFAVDTVKGIATAVPRSATHLYQGAQDLDSDTFTKGTKEFISEVTPLALGGSGLGVTGVKRIIANRAAKSAATRAATATNSLAVLATPGVKGTGRAVQHVAESVQPYLRAQFEKFGIDPKSIPIHRKSPSATGEMLAGGSMQDVDRVAKILGKKSTDIESIPLEIVDAMVDDVHAPIKAAIDPVRTKNIQSTVDEIADALDAKAVDALDPAQAKIYQRLAREMRTEHDVGGVMDRKVYANKKAAPLYDKSSPGAAVEAQANASFAYRDLGDIIREKLYPALERDYGIKGLLDQGKLEVNAMDVRDGTYLTWGVANKSEAVKRLETWLQKYGTDVVRSQYFQKAAIVDSIRRALEREPLETFNKLFRDAADIDYDPLYDNPARRRSVYVDNASLIGRNALNPAAPEYEAAVRQLRELGLDINDTNIQSAIESADLPVSQLNTIEGGDPARTASGLASGVDISEARAIDFLRQNSVPVNLENIELAKYRLANPTISQPNTITQSDRTTRLPSGEIVVGRPLPTDVGVQPHRDVIGRPPYQSEYPVTSTGAVSDPARVAGGELASNMQMQDYLRQQALAERQAGIYKQGEPPQPQGQLSLERGMSPTVMGMDQTTTANFRAAINSIPDKELLSVIDQYAKHRPEGSKPWSSMSGAERQAEFLQRAKEDLANAPKHITTDPVDYASRRSGDATDPFAGVYQLLGRHLTVKRVGQAAGESYRQATAGAGQAGLFPESPLNRPQPNAPAPPRPPLDPMLEKRLGQMSISTAKSEVPDLKTYKALPPDLKREVDQALKNNDMRTVIRVLTDDARY